MTALLLCCTMLGASDALAQTAGTQAQAERKQYQIPAQPLDAALMSYGRQAGLSIAPEPSLFAGRTSVPLNGSFSDQEALDRLLAGSGVRYVIDRETRSVNFLGQQRSDTALPIAPALAAQVAPPPRIAMPELPPEQVTVTGSRIRGAPSVSPVISMTQEQIRNAGFVDLGEVARSLPQNFNGGQNPAVGSGAGGSNNFDLNAASNINLRGLGPDATLTLLNGHRLAADGASAGVDIAAIPLLAVDRIEVIADGASALYGSDAVGGVANVILKRDFQGVMTSARFGMSTDGGNEQQQYGVIAGQTWDSGGAFVAYDFNRNTAITARQRSYAGSMDGAPNSTRRSSATASPAAHTSGWATISNSAWTRCTARSARNVRSAYTAGTGYAAGGSWVGPTVESYSIAPHLDLHLGNGWQVSLLGAYGVEDTRYDTRIYAAGVQTSNPTGCYCNTASRPS